MAIALEIGFYNSFCLKKVTDSNGDPTRPAHDGGSPDESDQANHWYVEESRIRGGYNNTITDLGKKAFIVEESNKGQTRGNAIIYSGIYNSRTNINDTNVFSTGEDITRAVDPFYGSIQLLYAEDSNLIIFQEDKVSRALIDKDAIYSAEGSPITTSANLVIGQIQPYAGEYGISKDPNSFAVYGYQKYFADKRRNAILRLSMDGITEISSAGMTDFFRDSLSSSSVLRVDGFYDVHSKNYIVTITQNLRNGYETLAYDERVKGWVSFYDYKPRSAASLRNKVFSLNDLNKLYQHHSGDEGLLYDIPTASKIQFVFNQSPSIVKNFKTINYEGTSGWQLDSFVTDYESSKPISNETDGQYTIPGVQDVQFAGFQNKEGKYHAFIKSDTNTATSLKGRVLLNDSMGNTSKSGVKGFFATVELSTKRDAGAEELFASTVIFNNSTY